LTLPDRASAAGGLASLESEREVVTALQRGERQALATLYEWYGNRLYRQAILPRLPIVELAEDVLRDTFRIALERIEQFHLEDRSIFFWLRRIAINRALDVHRAYARDRRLEDKLKAEPMAAPIGTPAHAPDRKVEVEETAELVSEALELLNPRYAMALRLRLLEDKSREACAAELGVKVGNFDVILHRATKAFRKIYPPR
jgi:RNA polymerase sigma-70 factor (ECF subfamily)